ncbi:conserved carboxylase domain protein [Mycobacterium kansasii 824]|nr:conserved carboxylase domain protein [Mycobacterium kansasii 824]
MIWRSPWSAPALVPTNSPPSRHDSIFRIRCWGSCGVSWAIRPAGGRAVAQHGAGRPGAAKSAGQLTGDDEAALAVPGPKRQAVLNRLLFPGPTKEFEEHRETYGDTSQLSANQFFYGLRQGEEHRVKLERGVELLIGLEAISEPDERGMRTVMCIINGQLRPVLVRDRSIASSVPAAEKADRGNPGHIAAPFAGVVTIAVIVGDHVTAGQTIATIEAMKMEAPITAPNDGTVQRVAVSDTAQVEGGDLLAVVS